MEDINIGSFKRKFLMENQDEDPAKDHFEKAEDNLYKAVTGEDPKVSSQNKFREEPKEELSEGSLYDEWGVVFQAFYDKTKTDKAVSDIPLKFIEWARKNCSIKLVK